MSKTKSYREQLSKWWNPSALQKAENAFDRGMRTIMREIQQVTAKKPASQEATETIKDKIRFAIVEYLNSVEQARGLGEGETKTPMLTSKSFELFQGEDIVIGVTKDQGLGSALAEFNTACNEFADHVWRKAKGTDGTGKEKESTKKIAAAPEFAEDRHKILQYFSAVLLACVGAFAVHKKELISLAEVGKNSEGAKLALLVVGIVMGSAGAAKLAHTCLVGDSKQAKDAIERVRDDCSGIAESFKTLAKVAAQESEKGKGV